MLQRLEVFQDRVSEDRTKLGIATSRSERQASAYVDIHRSRVLEDGYMQLSCINPRSLKGTVRVKFINEQVWTMEHGPIVQSILLIVVSVTNDCNFRRVSPLTGYRAVA